MRKQNVSAEFRIDSNGRLKRPVLLRWREITLYKLVMAGRYSSEALQQALTKYEFWIVPVRSNGSNTA